MQSDFLRLVVIGQSCYSSSMLLRYCTNDRLIVSVAQLIVNKLNCYEFWSPTRIKRFLISTAFLPTFITLMISAFHLHLIHSISHLSLSHVLLTSSFVRRTSQFCDCGGTQRRQSRKNFLVHFLSSLSSTPPEYFRTLCIN